MGRDTKIAWCHHTFNGVRGCAKVSPGCDTCYAESMSKRNPAQLGVWGEEGTRILGGPDYWANLDKWHRAAVRDGVLRRVFCYSLGDVFESPRGIANADVCAKGRALLFAAIERLSPSITMADGTHRKLTPALSAFDPAAPRGGLIFLLLTKRPENVKRMVPSHWLVTGARRGSALGWPQHVWLGASVENQQAAEGRIPHLLAVPGVPVRFLSIEPLLERVDLRRWLEVIDVEQCGLEADYLAAGLLQQAIREDRGDAPRGIGWLIPGGEGLGRRPCDLSWIRDIRDQGKAAGVPVFVKQMGSNPMDGVYAPRPERPLITVSRVLRLEHPKGEDPDEWPEDLRVREVPEVRL